MWLVPDTHKAGTINECVWDCICWPTLKHTIGKNVSLFPQHTALDMLKECRPRPFIRQRHPKNLRDTQRWWRERVGQGEPGSKETREQGTLFCSTWFHKLVEFIAYKRTSWTARQQLLCEPGEVGRGLCQSAAGKMMSFLYKIQWPWAKDRENP